MKSIMQTEEDMVDIINVDNDEDNIDNLKSTFAKVKNKVNTGNKKHVLVDIKRLNSEDVSENCSSEDMVEESSSLCKGFDKVDYPNLKTAIDKLRNLGSLVLTSLHYEIPQSVLLEKLLARILPDVSTLLTNVDEDNLVKWILRNNKANTLVFKYQLMEKVVKFKKVSKISRVFHKSKYGQLWYLYFMSSHPEIYENEGLLLRCDTSKNKNRKSRERHTEESSNDEMIKTKGHKSVRKGQVKRQSKESRNNETIKTEKKKSVRRWLIDSCNGDNSNGELTTIEGNGDNSNGEMTTIEDNGDNSNGEMTKIEDVSEQLLSAFKIKEAVVVLERIHSNIKENESSELKENISANSEAVERAYNAVCMDRCSQSNEDKQETYTISQNSKISSYAGKDKSNNLYSKYKNRLIEIKNCNYKAKCKICKKILINKKKLAAHFLRVHNNGNPQTPVVCSKCFKLFPSEYRYNIHVNIVHNFKHYKCNQCDRIFKCKISIRVHCKKEHFADKFSPRTLFVCDLCDQRFKFKKNLEHHIVNEHPEKEKELRIVNEHPRKEKEHCIVNEHPQKEKELRIVNEHPIKGKEHCIVNEHPKKEKELCIGNEHLIKEKEHCRREIYQKSLTTSCHLERHRLVNMKKRTFICPGCGKTFFHNSLLSKHMHSCSMNRQKDIDLECERISKEYLEEIALD